jgi:hypothetical protein
MKKIAVIIECTGCDFCRNGKVDRPVIIITMDSGTNLALI